MLVCQASTILPLGTTSPAATALRTNGAASAVVATAVCKTLRRLSFVLSIFSSLTKQRRRRLSARRRASMPPLPDMLLARALRELYFSHAILSRRFSGARGSDCARENRGNGADSLPDAARPKEVAGADSRSRPRTRHADGAVQAGDREADYGLGDMTPFR